MGTEIRVGLQEAKREAATIKEERTRMTLRQSETLSLSTSAHSAPEARGAPHASPRDAIILPVSGVGAGAQITRFGHRGLSPELELPNPERPQGRNRTRVGASAFPHPAGWARQASGVRSTRPGEAERLQQGHGELPPRRGAHPRVP